MRRFLRQAPRRREQQPQSETAMLEPRRESQDIAELKAEVSALKAEIRARRSTSASCTNERFRNDSTANWFSRAWGLRNGIAGEIQLAIVFCNAVREAVIQAFRREGTPHHHHPASDGKHN